MLPIVETQDAVGCWGTTKEDNDTNDDQACDGEDLDEPNPELDFTKVFHCTELQGDHCHPEDGDPRAGVNWGPVFDDESGSSDFRWGNQGLCVEEVQTGGEGQRGVSCVSLAQGEDGCLARDWNEGDHFGKLVHDEPHEEGETQVADKESCRATCGER